MAETLTTNYSMKKPEDGASTGVWGPFINDGLDIADTQMKVNEDAAATAQAAADASLAKAGGVMSGEIDVLTARMELSALGNWTGGSNEIDLDVANAFTATVTATCTVTIANAEASHMLAFSVRITNAGAFVITWPATVKWPGGSQPSWTASGTDVVTMLSFDGGTTWQANAVLDLS